MPIETVTKRWNFEVIEVRPAQYSLTFSTPSGARYTLNRIIGGSRLLAKFVELVQIHIWLREGR